MTKHQSDVPNRRALLRAAISAAPLLATLPNRTALANASALTCADKIVQDLEKGGPPPGVIDRATPTGDVRYTVDNSLRVEATYKKITKVKSSGALDDAQERGSKPSTEGRLDGGGGANPLHPADLEGTVKTDTVEVYIFRDIVTGNSVWVDMQGNYVAPDSWRSGTVISQRPVSLLVLFEHGGDRPVMRVREGCAIKDDIDWSSAPVDPTYCVYPVAELPSVDNNNLHMYPSCYCSLYPEDAKCGPDVRLL